MDDPDERIGTTAKNFKYLPQPSYDIASELLSDIHSPSPSVQNSAILNLRNLALKQAISSSSIPIAVVQDLIIMISDDSVSFDIRLQILEFIKDVSQRNKDYMDIFASNGIHSCLYSLLKSVDSSFRLDHCLPILDVFSSRSPTSFTYLKHQEYLRYLLGIMSSNPSPLYSKIVLTSIAEYTSNPCYSPDSQESISGMTELSLSFILKSGQLDGNFVSPAIIIMTNLIRVSPKGPHIDSIVASNVSILILSLLDPANPALSEICANFLVISTYSVPEICTQLENMEIHSYIAANESSVSAPYLYKVIMAIYNCVVGNTFFAISTTEAEFTSFLAKVLKNGPSEAVRQAVMLASLTIGLLPNDSTLKYARGLEIEDTFIKLIDSGPSKETSMALIALSTIAHACADEGQMEDPFVKIMLTKDVYELFMEMKNEENEAIKAQAQIACEWIESWL